MAFPVAEIRAPFHPLIERARERAVKARIPSDLGRVMDMWPGLGHNIFEWNARNYGLAIAYGMDYTDPGSHSDHLPTQAQLIEIRAAEAARQALHQQSF